MTTVFTLIQPSFKFQVKVAFQYIMVTTYNPPQVKVYQVVFCCYFLCSVIPFGPNLATPMANAYIIQTCAGPSPAVEKWYAQIVSEDKIKGVRGMLPLKFFSLYRHTRIFKRF